MPNSTADELVVLMLGLLIGILLEVTSLIMAYKESSRKILTGQRGTGSELRTRQRNFRQVIRGDTNMASEAAGQPASALPRSSWLAVGTFYGFIAMLVTVLWYTPIEISWWLLLVSVLVGTVATQQIFALAVAGQIPLRSSTLQAPGVRYQSQEEEGTVTNEPNEQVEQSPGQNAEATAVHVRGRVAARVEKQQLRNAYRIIIPGLIFITILCLVMIVLLSPLRSWIADSITSLSPLLDWIAVAALGALVGMGELIARYKDAPFRALLTSSAVMYVAINATAALGALFLIRAFGWEFGIGSQQGQPSSDFTVRVTQVMVAGLGAMALLRTSFFITRVGNEDVGVGPNAFLSALLRACDAGVERARAAVRANRINEAMTGISYAKANKPLIQVSAGLMQNLPAEGRQDLQDKAQVIGSLPMSEHAKAVSLGFLIMNSVGLTPLEQAIEALGPDIREDDNTDDHDSKLVF